MTRPDRTSVAGARYLDLQRKARQSGRPTDELIQLYALECFLDRLTQSAFARNLVLKGGVLLAAFDARRPTRDIDLAASSLRNTEAEILAVVRDIAAISLDDGVAFDPERATAEIIREEDDYSGIRVTLGGTLSRATVRLHVDVNVGDPIWPEPSMSACRGCWPVFCRCVATHWKWCSPRKSQQLLPEVLLTPDGATLSTCMRWLCAIQ
jgi:hypothetical protein